MSIEELIDELKKIQKEMESVDFLNRGRGIQGVNQKKIYNCYNKIENLINKIKEN